MISDADGGVSRSVSEGPSWTGSGHCLGVPGVRYVRRMDRGAIGSFQVEMPTNRRERMRGLLGRTGIEPGRGMLFEGARSVHTVGMRFAILVAFLDDDLRVIEVRRLPPRRFARNARARHVL